MKERKKKRLKEFKDGRGPDWKNQNEGMKWRMKEKNKLRKKS